MSEEGEEDLMQGEDLEHQVAALGKKLRLLMIISVLAVVVAIGGISFGIIRSASMATEVDRLREVVLKVDSGNEEALRGILDDERKVGAIHSLGNFVVNLVDPGNVRYVNTRIELEVEDAEFLPQILKRDAQLKDSVISLLGSRTYEELTGLDGKTRLREELTARFNRLLPEGQVARIYFTEFVIQ